MEIERSLGFEPIDREFEKLGYDIESRIPGTGKLRFLEVKGRVTGADTITVTKNEILYSLNKPDDFILAIVEFLDGDAHRVHYLRRPFQREPDFGVTSVNYDFGDLIGVPTSHPDVLSCGTFFSEKRKMYKEASRNSQRALELPPVFLLG